MKSHNPLGGCDKAANFSAPLLENPDCPDKKEAKKDDKGFKAVREKRLKLCLTCPALRRVVKLPKTEQCGICMCFVRVKTAIPGESCPSGFW